MNPVAQLFEFYAISMQSTFDLQISFLNNMSRKKTKLNINVEEMFATKGWTWLLRSCKAYKDYLPANDMFAMCRELGFKLNC